MEDWQTIDTLPGLKRRLWDYPDAPKPREPKEGPSVHEQRWFYVEEHDGEEGKEREIFGPTTKEDVREKYETSEVSRGGWGWGGVEER